MPASLHPEGSRRVGLWKHVFTQQKWATLYRSEFARVALAMREASEELCQLPELLTPMLMDVLLGEAG